MKKILLSLTLALWVSSALCAQTSHKGSYDLKGDTEVSQLVEKHIELNERTKTISGYRIQIASLSGSNSRTEAFRLKDEFKTMFPSVEAYVIFDEPNFKVKVGDFITRLDAYMFQQKMKANFPGNIIRDDIYPIHQNWNDIVPETDADAEM